MSKPSLPAVVGVKPETTPIPAERPLPDDLAGLPALMVEIAEVAGVEAAITICDRYGGNRVYIPRYANDHHWLTQCVGRAAANAICEHFASPSGIELELPTGARLNRAQRRLRLEQMIKDGCKSPEITRRLGVTRRQVKRVAAALNRDLTSRQLDMFLPAPEPSPHQEKGPRS